MAAPKLEGKISAETYHAEISGTYQEGVTRHFKLQGFMKKNLERAKNPRDVVCFACRTVSGPVPNTFLPSTFLDYSWYQPCQFGSSKNADSKTRLDPQEIHQGKCSWKIKLREQELAESLQTMMQSNPHGRREKSGENEVGRVMDCSLVPRMFRSGQ